MSIIKDREACRQIRLFQDLWFGNEKRRPGDIDGFFDDQGQKFIFIELKKNHTPEDNNGQMLGLKHLCDACERGGVETVAIIGNHYTEPPEDIYAPDAEVKKVYRNGRWSLVDGKVTLKEYMADFLENKHD